MSIHKELQTLAETDPDEAARQATRLLDENPLDPLALFLIGSIYAKAERFGLAYNLFQRVVDIRPDRAEAWNNVGMSLQGLHDSKKAREAFLRAGKLDAKSPNYPANVALTYLEERDYRKALEWCERAFKFDPKHLGANTTYGMANLALGNWSEGWQGMAYAVGGKFRKEVVYGDEDRWDGSPGKSVVIYGEQGLGDEVMYASCVPDAIANCREVVIECDPRLQGLFARSFPTASVYGTRRQTEVDWLERHELDARCPIGQLPQFYRPTPESCPGTPYLIADPERRIQWRALFDSFGKKTIGLAWSGGSKHNNPEARSMGLEALRPLIEGVDATFVSLQYRDATEEIAASGLPVKHWRRACETPDYDDTAAMVAELDLVVSVPTTVVHLAGALGVETHCLVPDKIDWNFQRDTLPWYRSVTLMRKNKQSWKECVEQYVSRFHRV